MPSPLESVDPFLGNGATSRHERRGIAATWYWPKAQTGNTHPGACSPFGMVSACAYSGAYVSGYGLHKPNTDGQPDCWFDEYTASGFTHFQQSGTGAIEAYYNYLRVTPLTNSLDQLGTRWAIEDETATPGYYACTINDIRSELTVSPKSAVHRYTFPSTDDAQIAIDISNGGIKSDSRNRRTYPSETSFEIQSDHIVAGSVTMADIPIYFYIQCDAGVETAAIWDSKREIPETRTFTRTGITEENFKRFGVNFHLKSTDKPAIIRIGFSLRSVEQAQKNTVLDQSFDQTLQATQQKWDARLNRIRIQGGTEDQHQIFYSALYHSLIKPIDCTDEAPFCDGSYITDMATLWDQYKTQMPLIFTVYPEFGSTVVNGMLAIAEQFGVFPNGYVLNTVLDRFDKQSSARCHVSITDAFVRNLDGIDWERAKRLMSDTLLKGEMGRNFLIDGYTHPFTHTLDLSCSCFCLSQIAKALGDTDLYNRMKDLYQNWKNVYDPETGMLGESKYYEGVAWNYSFRLFHNEAERIALCGSEEKFVEALDSFFGYGAPPFEQLNKRPYDKQKEYGFSLNRFEGINNQSDMETPYTYIYAGRPDRTAEVARAVMTQQYVTGRGGLPGNDDSGGLSSWYVWSAMGIFPVAGQDIYLIGSTLFDRVELNVKGQTFTIEARNNSDENIYVQNAELNGEPLNRAYLRHAELASGATLTLHMGSEPTNWGQDERPPSYA